ncbi:hypothetical protein KI387_006275, partial [Taxus chinensis]
GRVFAVLILVEWVLAFFLHAGRFSMLDIFPPCWARIFAGFGHFGLLPFAPWTGCSHALDLCSFSACWACVLVACWACGLLGVSFCGLLCVLRVWCPFWVPFLPSTPPQTLPLLKLGTDPLYLSAYAILFPWKTVFCADLWEQVMVCFIIPKLMAVLQDFTINPTNQELDQFYWVIAWESTIPVHHMVTMLEVGFFPMWQHVLYQWLCSGPDFDEVRKWFLRWKWYLPLELLANERIKSQLILGLGMMDQAVDGMTVKQPEVRETVSYLREKEQHRLGMKDNLTYLRVKEQCQFEALQKQQAVAEAAYDQKDASTSLGCMICVNNSMGVPQLSLKEVIECGVLEELVDPNLEIDVKHVVKEMVCRVAKLAFRCLAAEKDDRPNMTEVSA